MGAEDFVKLSVRYRVDFKLAGVSPAAELAFLRSLAYCGLNGTGGLILAEDLKDLGPKRAASELVAAGFWLEMPAGWAISRWDKWQGDFELVNQQRKAAAERQREKRRRDRMARLEEGDVA